MTNASIQVFAVVPVPLTRTVYNMSAGGDDSTKLTQASVSGKTYTREELEAQATARVAARFNIPNDRLLALAAKYPPPPAWLETAEEKPF